MGTFPGYVEGEYVNLASPYPGRLEKLLVENGSTVAAGTLLFELDAECELLALDRAEQEQLAAVAQLADMEAGKRPEEIAVAEARLNRARIEAANAKALLLRHEILAEAQAISEREWDDLRAASDISEASVAELAGQLVICHLPEREKRIEAQRALVKAADARIAQARWELGQKQIRAPAAGLVSDVLFRPGEWVPAGSPVVRMLPPANVKVLFFVPEARMDGIRPGDLVSVEVDGRREKFSATVSRVASNAEYAPPIIYSNETRSKLVFQIEAKPDTAAQSCHPGQPVKVGLP